MSPFVGDYTEEEQVQMLMEAMGIGEVEARFIRGIETGKIKSDVIESGDEDQEEEE